MCTQFQTQKHEYQDKSIWEWEREWVKWVKDGAEENRSDIPYHFASSSFVGLFTLATAFWTAFLAAAAGFFFPTRHTTWSAPPAAVVVVGRWWLLQSVCPRNSACPTAAAHPAMPAMGFPLLLWACLLLLLLLFSYVACCNTTPATTTPQFSLVCFPEHTPDEEEMDWTATAAA